VPVYQYLCPKCNLRFELKQNFSDESIATCPRCQNGARRLFSPVPIIFKGSGFYVTDNATKNGALDNIKKNKKADKDGDKETGK